MYKKTTATQGERLMKMETDIGYIKETQKTSDSKNDDQHEKIITKLDDFINASDKKYATKSELQDVKLIVNENKNNAGSWVRTVLPLLLSLATLCIVLFNLFKR